MEIVGDNVSIGYFKNDELNQQKFEKNMKNEVLEQETLDILKMVCCFCK